MTIAIGIACPDALVLAADSRAIVVGETTYRIASDHAQKVFDLNGRCATAHFGWAFLQGNTVAGIMEEFLAQRRLPKEVDGIAEAMRDYFAERLSRHLADGRDEPPPAGVDALGFIIAGYAKDGVGHLKRVFLPSGDILPGASTAANNCGAVWDGQPDVVSRLVQGYDTTRIDTSSWAQHQRDDLEAAQYLIPFSAMAVQDAVDFARFIIRTTIEMLRFSDGTLGEPGSFPACGGSISVTKVTSAGLGWVDGPPGAT